MFPCTPTLSGQLYPNPAKQWACTYILDFLNNHGTHVHDTGFNFYDRDVQGRGRCGRLICGDALGTPGHQGTMDLFILNTTRVVEITDGNDQRLKVISFSYLNRSVPVPVFL